MCTKKSKFQYVKKVQLITCIFKSKHFIESFLENCANLSTHAELTHSLIGSNPDRYSFAAVINYLSSDNDGFYVNLKSDPGLYDCWNTLIKLSNEQYLSNANPDDLRIDSHLEKLIAILDMEEYEDIFVASSNVFPIYPSNRFNSSLAEIVQEAGTGWFSDTPDQYGIEHLFDISLDENSLITPHNIPHCAPVWRREIHIKHGYFDESRYGSEADYVRG